MSKETNKQKKIDQIVLSSGNEIRYIIAEGKVYEKVHDPERKVEEWKEKKIDL